MPDPAKLVARIRRWSRERTYAEVAGPAEGAVNENQQNPNYGQAEYDEPEGLTNPGGQSGRNITYRRSRPSWDLDRDEGANQSSEERIVSSDRLAVRAVEPQAGGTTSSRSGRGGSSIPRISPFETRV